MSVQAVKLDRNKNQDGKGKYALINLRTNKVEWGGNEGDRFFVLKYKDRFTSSALRAYSKACDNFAENCGDSELYESLKEFAREVSREADMAETIGTKIPT